MNVVALHQPSGADPLSNIEAEAAFLGALLINNDLIDSVAHDLKSSDFAEPLHGRIFATILHEYEGGKPVNPTLLLPHFATDETIKQLGGVSYLARLTADGQAMFAPHHFSAQIQDLAQRRRIRAELTEALAGCCDPAVPLSDITPIDPGSGACPSRRLPVIDLASWEGTAPARRSAWGDKVPLNTTTMLTGSGGIGKSLFAQMLSTAWALGRSMLGLDTMQGCALYITAEDDEEELWRRQEAICQTFGIPIKALAGKLHLVSLNGETDTALATFSPEGRLVTTPRWREVKEAAKALDVRYFCFDNASDLMAGDHNDVHAVAGFVNLLTGLAIERDGASLLLHHPNKGGDDWLGSVAWHNKVRSRLIMKRADADADPDARIIETPKSNYGPSGGKLEFRWHQGAFIREADLPLSKREQLAEVIAANGANAAFLACLKQRSSEGEARSVGPTPGPNYAPSQFEGMKEAKGHDRHALKQAMDRLFAIGRIRIDTYRNKGKGRDVTVIREVPELSPNPLPNSSRTLFPNSPEAAPNSPRTHSPLLKERGDAAPEAAASPIEERI